MSSRNAKSRANEKISTNTSKKRGCKRKEVVDSSLNDLNDPLSNTKQQKVVVISLPSNDRDNNIPSKNKRGHKKKQESVVFQPLQIITEFLNDDISNIIGDNISNDDVAQGFTTTQETEFNSQNTLMLNSRGNNCNQDDFISSNRIAFSRFMSIPDSREDSLILYRSMLALESRNGIDLNRASEIVSNSRANSQFDYVFLNNTSRSRPISPLRSRNNTMNILRNDTHDVETNSIHHFDITNKVVPSPFNEIMIYQLCLWLYENSKVLQLANYMHLSIQMQIIEGSQFMSSNFSRLNTMPS
ncbi:21307_t:CDS:2 [Racocetra persica]|uniref:21307_t:CDS:1 n=1 Tax=Racocetra persica TaxID=160502 RepID=A0ACA9LV08_9GLOM|nr:21307_t:CDS:2 [Racocetra persica]